MLKGGSEHLSSIVKLFIIICVILASLIITNIIGLILIMPVFKIGFFNFLTILQSRNYNNHLYVNILKYLQIWQTVGVFILPPLFVGYLFSINSGEYLRLNKKPNIVSLFIALLIVFASIPIVGWMVDINSKMSLPHFLKSLEHWMKSTESEAGVITKAFLNVTTVKGFSVNLLMIALLPAIGEEFLFRGLFVKFFKDWTKNSHIAVWLSAIIFSLIHFQFYGFLPRMMLGVLLGYLFVWSGTIWVPVFAHFINNGSAVVGSFMQSKGLIKTDIDELFSHQSSYIYLFISIIATIVFIVVFYNMEKRRVNIKSAINS